MTLLTPCTLAPAFPVSAAPSDPRSTLKLISLTSHHIRSHAAVSITRDGVIRFDWLPWNVAPSQKRARVVATSYVKQDWTESFGKALANCGLSELHPMKRTEPRDSPLSTWFPHLDPGDMPTHPLPYCAFDVVFLAGKDFSFRRGQQLGAIVGWVRAGGSVCVVPSGRLTARHVQFLNQLADCEPPSLSGRGEGEGETRVRPSPVPLPGRERGEEAPVFSLDAQGRLEARGKPFDARDRLRAEKAHTGPGRSVVLHLPSNLPQVPTPPQPPAGSKPAGG